MSFLAAATAEGTRTFLQDLALVFCVATLATLIMQRLRQPIVLGYLVAGVIIGPKVPIPVFVDAHRIETLAELGIILVMFSIGLELSLKRVARLLPTAGLAALVQIAGMLWLGYLVGGLFGLKWPEDLFLGGMICISSTMIISRAFASQKVETELVDSVFGILVVQDIAAILLIAIFTAVATGSGLPPAELVRTVGALGLFVGALIVFGLLLVPRLVREANHLRSKEVLLVAAIGCCFGLSLLAEHFGYSVALGAFTAGMLVGESGHRAAVEHMVAPLRDVFAGVFFVSIGMLVDPIEIVNSWALVLTLCLVVLVGQTFFISVGYFLVGKRLELSIRSGMTLAQIGEFSFIIVGVGVATGAVSPRLFAVAVAVAVVTTFLTPLMVGWSKRVAHGVERRIPAPLQAFTSLYASWFESLRERRPQREGSQSSHWLLFGLDSSVVLGLVLFTASSHRWLAGELAARTGLTLDVAAALVIGGATLVIVPFLFGVVRMARNLGRRIAERALPASETGVDLADAPRRAFVLALQLGLVCLVMFPIIAITQPFLPSYAGLLVVFGLVALGVAFWRSASNLDLHVRAGAQVVLEALDRQRQIDAPTVSVAELLPGLGPLVARPIHEGSPAVGKTLAEINLRGQSGATVIAIKRAGGDVVTPSGKERLQAGDTLSLTGSKEAIASADQLLEFQPDA